MGFGLALGLVTSLPARSEAARIGRYLTAEDRSRPVLLADTGRQIQLRSLTHPDPVPPAGTVPTYLAFPLHESEHHLPSDTPTLSTGPKAGDTTVGPLHLDPLIQSKLNAALDASGMAVVDTPHRNYLVEFLPRIARLRSAQAAEPSPSSGSAASSAQAAQSPGTSRTTTASTSSTSATPSPAVQSINGIPTSELSQWFKIGSNQLIRWSSTGFAAVEKTFNIGNPKATATKPSLNLAVAAQQLVPPGSAAASSAPLPAPIPEPSTWLIFGLIIGAAGLHRRGLRRVGATD
jgi:hypothetical protein